MANKSVEIIHEFLTKNKLIVIIIILLGITATLYSFFQPPTEKYFQNIQNSTFNYSPVVQQSSNISVIYNFPPESDIYSPFYLRELSLTTENLFKERKYHLYFMKFILPDDQEILLEEVLFNTTYKIASCNEEWTDCYIYHKYRNREELTENDTCWVYITRFGHDELVSDRITGGKRLSNDPNSCSKLVT